MFQSTKLPHYFWGEVVFTGVSAFSGPTMATLNIVWVLKSNVVEFAKSYFVSKKIHIYDILHKFHMETCKPSSHMHSLYQGHDAHYL